MESLVPLILILPLVGFLFNALFGRRFVDADREIGERWSGWFASIMALSAFGIAVLQLIGLIAEHGHAPEPVLLFDWINAGGFSVNWAMQVDTLSVTMMLVVTGVGSLIHIYAIGYMHGDKDFSRFFAYLNLFLFFMLILVTGSNFLMLFVGWEGVGLCSFLLIGFWFHEWKNADAARKAFVANRVGDFAMILAMILTFWTFHSLDFNIVFTDAVELFESGEMVHILGGTYSLGAVLTVVTTLFLVGAAGKSAQIPLYVWLPDAMAGPTPVSALIHAATMVTSGIYLITRSNVFFEIVRASEVTVIGNLTSPDLVAYTGGATALLAGLIAFTQFDIKKVLAYSTVSQLGFMIAAVGMGAYVAGMFHLITHAFFKALLFLGSGSVIHGMEHGHHHIHDHAHEGDHGTPQADEHSGEDHFDPQDMRTMGGLRHKMPWTFRTYMVGALALSGIVPLAGFWSKDEILAFGNETNMGVYILLSLAAVCTAFYMGRQLKMTFFGQPRHEAAEHASESSRLMTVPLMILAVLAILGGFMNFPYLSSDAYHDHAETQLGLPVVELEHWLEHSIPSFELTEEGILHLPHVEPVLNPIVAGVSTVLAILALVLAMFVVYGRRPQKADERDPLQSIPVVWSFFAALPLNTLYMRGVIPVFNRLAHWLAHTLDWRIWHDGFHDRIVRDGFVGLARFASSVLDARGVDGAVNGTARLANTLSQTFRRLQTGFVRNYALGVLLGVVAILAYLIFV